MKNNSILSFETFKEPISILLKNAMFFLKPSRHESQGKIIINPIILVQDFFFFNLERKNIRLRTYSFFHGESKIEVNKKTPINQIFFSLSHTELSPRAEEIKLKSFPYNFRKFFTSKGRKKTFVVLLRLLSAITIFYRKGKSYSNPMTDVRKLFCSGGLTSPIVYIPKLSEWW